MHLRSPVCMQSHEPHGTAGQAPPRGFSEGAGIRVLCVRLSVISSANLLTRRTILLQRWGDGLLNRVRGKFF